MQDQDEVINIHDVGRICASIGASFGMSNWAEPGVMGAFVAGFVNVYKGRVSSEGQARPGGVVFYSGGKIATDNSFQSVVEDDGSSNYVQSSANDGKVSNRFEGCIGREHLRIESNYSSTRALPRGPNYIRNQQSRFRKKVAKEERKKNFLQTNWRDAKDDDSLVELEKKVRRMKLERQEIQEQRKLDKLKSPAQMIEDAMRQVALAEKYAKLANDSKVAAWAANLSSASAESIAKSAGSLGSAGFAETVKTGFTSVSNGSGNGEQKKFNGKERKEKSEVDISFSPLSVSVNPLNIYEKKAILITARGSMWIEKHRQRLKRQLTPHEFMYDKELNNSITKKQLDQIIDADLN